jgi:large subunit ribosomal protein L17
MENRLGDNAEMALIELVDYNTVYGTDTAKTEKKSSRRRGGAKGKAAAPAAKAAPATTAEVTPADDETVIEAPSAKTEIPTASAEHEENAEKGE